jgi:predicted MPP superfamily phosphohydrolase
VGGQPIETPWYERLFDAACILSVAGLYPRFIEPNLISVSRYSIPLPTLPHALDGMKVLLFSDLHINRYSSPRFLNRLQKTIVRLSPDLIVFAGDLLSYASLPRPDLAAQFFDSLSAPFGVFACLGNHDYTEYSTTDQSGMAVRGASNGHPIIQGLKRLFGAPRSSLQSPVSAPLPLNDELVRFYSDHNVALLHNETIHVGAGGQRVNLTGLGDLTSGHLLPSRAYKGYDPRSPGIVFGHNPDSYAYLSYFPGDLFLFGHTHGGQVNVPFIWEKITPLVDKSLKDGLYHRDGRTLFVTRGVGATFPFRLFAPPQVALFKLYRGGRAEARAPATSLLEPISSMPSYAAQRTSELEEPGSSEDRKEPAVQ